MYKNKEVKKTMKEVYYKFILYLGIAFLIALTLFVPMLIERLYDSFMYCNPCDIPIPESAWCDLEK